MHPLLDDFERNCANRATRPAASDPTLALDYQSLRAVACGLGAQIAAQTAQPHVGILAPTSAACAAAVFACWYANRVPVPLNFMLSPTELSKIIRDAGLDLIVSIDRFAPTVTAAGLKLLPLSAQTLVPGEGQAPAAAPADVGALIYTSGTSGDPKGVCLSFDNLAQNARACIAAAELSADQVFLGLLPQFHAFGLTATTIVPLVMGAAVHYLPRFSPVAVANTIAERGVSVFITIASMFGALAAMKEARAEQFASLTHPVSGGEPLPARVAQVFEQRYGKRIYEGYGMTEASPVITLNTPRAYRAGTVGRPLPGISVVAVDAHGATLPPGEEGELIVRGHCVMQGYLNKPDLTAATVRDGALRTGDVGHVDADGYVSITGRAKEMMIVGGENVFPFEIESVLVDHPGVAEAAVVGLQDDIRGEVPVAFVIPRPDAAPLVESELRGFCRERLAAYKVPRQITIATELPRGPTGKILKRALKVGQP
ncbi:MAG: AMP-binding protein [Phycisphaerae bacterium]|nr:AMP-binding protein [Phycisphaerae bacterium]